MCMWFGYNPLLIFSPFFFVNLVFFWGGYEMLSKCIEGGYLVGATPLTVFHRLFLKLYRFVLYGMKICMWFWYNTLIVVSHFFCFVNLVSFLDLIFHPNLEYLRKVTETPVFDDLHLVDIFVVFKTIQAAGVSAHICRNSKTSM